MTTQMTHTNGANGVGSAASRIMRSDDSMREARKYLGLGMPPDIFGSCDTQDAMLADACDPRCDPEVAESVIGRIDYPIADADIAKSFGERINIFAQSDNNPPPGFSTLTNTLSTPGMPNSAMCLTGIVVRVMVENEGRLIRGNLFQPTSDNSQPASFDVMSRNDQLRALGLVGSQTPPIPCELLWGEAVWKSMLAFIFAYEFVWIKTHQIALIKEPLTSIARVDPFSEAVAAGLAFGSNHDRIRDANQRLLDLLGASAPQMMPFTHKRLGSYTDGAGANAADVTITRDEDGSPTLFGGPGVPQSLLMQRSPYRFDRPMYWPLGQPMSIFFALNNSKFQAEMQRWMSVTGGTNGNPGLDLNLPFSPSTLMPGGLAPTSLSGDAATELTEDSPPIPVGQQTNTNRAILKGGVAFLQIDLIGRRVPQSWKGCVGRAIKAGAICAPMGTPDIQLPSA